MFIESEIIKKYGRGKYQVTNQKVWSSLTQAERNSIPFQALLKKIVAELEK